MTAAAAAAAGPAPSRRALSSQQGALRVAVAPAEARRVPCALRLVLIPLGAARGSQVPRAALACARHAPRTLGGVGACWVGFLCSVGRLWVYLGDFGAAAHRPPTIKKKNLAFGGSAGGGRVPGGALGLWSGGMHSPKCLFSSVCEPAAFRRISFSPNPTPPLMEQEAAASLCRRMAAAARAVAVTSASMEAMAVAVCKASSEPGSMVDG